MYLTRIKVGGRTIKKDDVLFVNSSGQKFGLGKVGNEVYVKQIAKIDNIHYLGIVSNYFHSGWSNLNGSVKNGFGLWVPIENAALGLDNVREEWVIDRKFIYKNQNLLGLSCKLIKRLDHKKTNDLYFVEFKKDIGGGSCDGLGKQGHCIVVETQFIKRKKIQE